MASSGSKCPECGKSIAVGLVSGTLVLHASRTSARCEGTGTTPVPRAASAASVGGSTKTPATRASGTASSASTKAAGAAKKKAAAPKVSSVNVKRVEVDPDKAARIAERQAKLREERNAAAAERGEVHTSYFDFDKSK